MMKTNSTNTCSYDKASKKATVSIQGLIDTFVLSDDSIQFLLEYGIKQKINDSLVKGKTEEEKQKIFNETVLRIIDGSIVTKASNLSPDEALIKKAFSSKILEAFKASTDEAKKQKLLEQARLLLSI